MRYQNGYFFAKINFLKFSNFLVFDLTLFTLKCYFKFQIFTFPGHIGLGPCSGTDKSDIFSFVEK